MFELSVDGLAVFFLLEGFALVVAVLASCEIDVEFSASVFVDEEQGGDDSGPWALGGVLQAGDFPAVQQKLAVASCGVIIIGAVEILGDVHVLHPDFTTKDDTIGIDETGLAETDAFDFRSGKDKACCVFINQVVVEFGLAILDVDGSLLFFGHECK